VLDLVGLFFKNISSLFGVGLCLSKKKLLLFLVSCIFQRKCVKTIEGLANDMVYDFF
jgi:hypothetical protein